MNNFLWINFFRTKENEVNRLLKKNHLFQDLSNLEINTLSEFTHIRNYRPGEFIFRQNEAGIGMYIIQSGKVDIIIEKNDDKKDKPAIEFVTQLYQNDFMGELSLVEKDSRRSASAKATTEVTLIGFFQPDLDGLSKSNPELACKILFRLSQVLGKRLSETAKKISELKRQMDALKE